MLEGASAAGRIDGLRMIAEKAADDPRCRVALFDRREHDPSRRVRKYASDLLAFNVDENKDGPPGLDEIAWVFQPTSRPADKWFARLDTEKAARRLDALSMMNEEAADDPRTLPVLLDRLERDPSPRVREDAASLLASRARDQPVLQALRDAASQDEDLQVRWAARCAIRLATSEDT
jgi:HEAT repeats